MSCSSCEYYFEVMEKVLRLYTVRLPEVPSIYHEGVACYERKKIAFFFFILFLYVHVSVCMCVCVHLSAVPMKTEEDTRSETEVTDSCELSWEFWESKSCPLEEHSMLLATELSL